MLSNNDNSGWLLLSYEYLKYTQPPQEEDEDRIKWQEAQALEQLRKTQPNEAH